VSGSRFAFFVTNTLSSQPESIASFMGLHFLYGLTASFLGGVAFGPINLSVVELTLRKDLRSATRFVAAAASVEVLQAYIAILFGKLIARSIENIPEFKLLVIAFFFLLGTYFFFKKDKVTDETVQSSRGSSFLNGMIVAALNPQAIPYWIFVLAYLKSANVIHMQSWNFALFLLGAYAGKFIVLMLYSRLSAYIKKRVGNLDAYVSKGIGGLLIIVGLLQAINYFFFR
jgi:threonine/homoserine/homoserine lactone efflux protein